MKGTNYILGRIAYAIKRSLVSKEWTKIYNTRALLSIKDYRLVLFYAISKAKEGKREGQRVKL